MDFCRGEEGSVAESAGAEALADADDLTAVEAVGRGGEEGVARGEAVAFSGGVVGGGGGEGGVGLEFEGADGGVEV